ncbi:MAG TPA: transposase [Anaerolineales bacterium]
MRKQYTPAQKAQIVLEVLKEEKTLTQIASEHGVHPSQLCRWRDKAIENLASLFVELPERAQEQAQAAEIEQLYAEIGRLTTQLTWLKKKSGGGHE